MFLHMIKTCTVSGTQTYKMNVIKAKKKNKQKNKIPSTQEIENHACLIWEYLAHLRKYTYW